jgi:hypothetical protein
MSKWPCNGAQAQKKVDEKKFLQALRSSTQLMLTVYQMTSARHRVRSGTLTDYYALFRWTLCPFCVPLCYGQKYEILSSELGRALGVLGRPWLVPLWVESQRFQTYHSLAYPGDCFWNSVWVPVRITSPPRPAITVNPPALRTLRYTYFWFTYNLFQCNIRNTSQNFIIRNLLNVLYLILRTLLNVLYFILRTLLNVLWQWRNKAKKCSVTSSCEYWTMNLCPLWSISIIFILDQIFIKILWFFGEDHQPTKPYYMQVYANPYLDLSTYQFKYYLFLINWVRKAGVDCSNTVLACGIPQIKERYYHTSTKCFWHNGISHAIRMNSSQRLVHTVQYNLFVVISDCGIFFFFFFLLISIHFDLMTTTLTFYWSLINQKCKKKSLQWLFARWEPLVIFNNQTIIQFNPRKRGVHGWFAEKNNRVQILL